MRNINEKDKALLQKLGKQRSMTLMQVASKIFQKSCVDCKREIMVNPRNTASILCADCQLRCEEELATLKELNKKLKEE